MDNKMIYLDLKKQKRTLEQNEFTIDASSEDAKAFFTPKGANQELVIDLEDKITYFEEYELDENGNRYSHYLDTKVNNIYVPDLDKQEAIKKEAEQQSIKQEAQAYINDTGWIWEKYKRNVEVLQNITKEEFLEKYQEVIDKQEECRKLL